MSSQIKAFLSEAKSCSTSQSLWAAYDDFMTSQNIEAWGYFSLPPVEEPPQSLSVTTDGLNGSTQKTYSLNPLPETFLPDENRVIKQHLRRLEHVQRLSMFATQQDLRPEIQSQLTALLGQNAKDKVLLFPTLAPRGYNGCFSMHVDSENIEILEDQSSMLVLACQTVHQMFQTQIRQKTKQPTCLSPREIQILDGIARGLTNYEIATELTISPHTVNGYLQRIFLKIDCKNRTTAVLTGLAKGLIY